MGISLICFTYLKFINVKKYKLITKDTVFLCPGDEYDDGKLVVVKKDEGKYENEVCDYKFKGKYVCENDYCEEPFSGQIHANYANYDEGIALLTDEIYVENEYSIPPTLGFLYDFKNNKKISKKYDFYTIIYENKDKNKKYFLTIDENNKSGIMDNKGNIVASNIYTQIGITPFEDGINGQLDNIIVAIKDNKFGFLDIETGEELTDFEFDKIGFINVSEPKDYDPNVISRHDTFVINKDLKEVYVEANGKGKIINLETLEVKKEFDKTYIAAYPISEDLIAVEDKNTVDIIDYNMKSVLDEKLEFENQEISYTIDENKVYIGGGAEGAYKGRKYVFDIETRKIEKNY